MLCRRVLKKEVKIEQLSIFLGAAVGTITGAIVGFFILKKLIDYHEKRTWKKRDM
jgi:uncharacterized membrane protein